MRNQILVGRTILSIDLDKDREAIRFNTDQGPVIAVCYADCCSQTWVESVELPALGFPALVTSAFDLDLKREPEEKEYEFIQFYGFKIATDKGEIVIDYRNSSNGYYGGSLMWPGGCYHYEYDVNKAWEWSQLESGK